MTWLHPTFLIGLAAVPVAILIFLWAALQRRRALELFGDRTLVGRLTAAVSTRRRRWKAAFVALGILLLAIALAGPRFGSKLREVKREGVDLVIALDVSLSMMAEDIRPNRLEKAKFEISRLIEQLSGDRVGLVLFAGEAFVQCPMTLDYSALRLFLDVANPEMIPVPGTDFGAAIKTAGRMLNAAGDSDSDVQRARALLIVSDGENHFEGLETAITDARENGIVVFAAGTGETAGVPIPISRNNRNVGYKKDSEGRTVSTKLEEDVLKGMAQDGGYYRIGKTASDLGEFRAALGGLEKAEFDKQMFEEYEEKYQWPLALGLLLLIGEWFLNDRRRVDGRRWYSFSRGEVAEQPAG